MTSRDVYISLQAVTPAFWGGAVPRRYFAFTELIDSKGNTLLEHNDRGNLVLTKAAKDWLRQRANEQHETRPEARVQSVRGALRWWLRAMLAGKNTGLLVATDQLWQAEAEVFGSTNEASSVMISLRNHNLQPTIMSEPEVNPKNPSGYDYMLYGMHTGKSDSEGHAYTPRQYYNESTGRTRREIDLAITPRWGAANGQPAVKQTLWAMWLLINFGGLGSRNRRGAGSVGTAVLPELPEWLKQQKEQNEDLKLPDFERAASLAQLRERLRDGLIAATNNPAWQNESITPRYADFSVLHPDYCTIAILGPNSGSGWSTAKEAIKATGSAFRTFRANPTNKPLNFRAFGYSLPNNRFASPLHFTIVQLSSRSFVVVMTWFHSNLPGGGTVPSQPMITGFVNHLRQSLTCKYIWEP